MLNYITWTVDPELFSIGSLTVRWYGLLWAIGIWLALVIVQKIFKHEKHPEAWVDKLFIYTVLGTIIGARLGHCFFYEWKELAEPVTFLGITFKYGNYYLSHPWELLYIWRGGLASHGGTLGLMIALWLYWRKTKLHYMDVVDMIAVATPVTACFSQEKGPCSTVRQQMLWTGCSPQSRSVEKSK